MVRSEAGVRLGRVGADAENRRAGLLELAPVVADVARLRRAARRLVLGVEVDDDGPPRRSLRRTVSPVSDSRAKSGAGCPGSIMAAASVADVNPFAPLGDRDFRLYFVGRGVLDGGLGPPRRRPRLVPARAHGLGDLGRAGLGASGSGRASSCCHSPGRSPTATRAARSRSGPTSCASCWSAAMAALAFAGSPSLPALYVLTFLVGLGHSVFWPSITALLQEVIRPEQLTAASGLAEITWQVGNLTGAALGGPILVRLRAGSGVRDRRRDVRRLGARAPRAAPSPGARRRAGTSRASRWRAPGWRICAAIPAIAGFGIASVIPWVATISLNVVLVAYVLDVLHLGRDRVRARRHDLRRRGHGVGDLRRAARAAPGGVAGDDRRHGGADRLLRRARGQSRRRFPSSTRVLFVAGFCSSAFRVDDDGVPLQGRARTR